MQQDEIRMLNKTLSSKNESIAAVVAENAELKQRELLLVSEYNEKLKEMQIDYTSKRMEA